MEGLLALGRSQVLGVLECYQTAEKYKRHRVIVRPRCYVLYRPRSVYSMYMLYMLFDTKNVHELNIRTFLVGMV
jgi:hypothetical protein